MASDVYNQPLKLTIEEGQQAMKAHAREKGYRLHVKYPVINRNILSQILCDSEFVKYPTSILYDRSRIESGLFAVAEKIFDAEHPRYVIYVHDFFKFMPDKLPHLVLYHLVSVNYGDFASDEAALEFGSAALNCDKEAYYQMLCELSDLIAD